MDAEGHMMLEENVEAEAAEAMQAAAEEYPELAGYYPKAKKVRGSWLLSTSSCRESTALLLWRPIIMETCRRRTYLLPSAMSFPHLKGFMREDEANFIAYLACRASDSAAFRYSGAMLA